MQLLPSRTIHLPPKPYMFAQFSRFLSVLGKMNPSGSNGGPSSLPTSDDLSFPEHDSSAVTNNRLSEVSRQQNKRDSSGEASNFPRPIQSLSYSNRPFDEEWPPISATLNTSSKNKNRDFSKQRTRVELLMEKADEFNLHEIYQTRGHAQQQDDISLPTCFGRKTTAPQDEFSLPTHLWGKGTSPSHVKRRQRVNRHKNNLSGRRNPYFAKEKHAAELFDICRSESRNSPDIPFRLNGVEQTVDFVQSEEMDELEHSEDGDTILRPGMVLLRSYLSHSEQIEIVKKCRDLGVGPGGFHQPCFRDGAKLRLQMMCFGLYWDPHKRKYFKRWPADGCTPPDIPLQFVQTVKRAINDSHALIKGKDVEISNVEDILPTISPDVCIVNFYTTTGRLGLHQDRDESEKSLRKGLPVVSFSIGDSAEFLYGDERDTEKAEKVVLKSGDVLIFGGRSRHVFHGVTSIIPGSAPQILLEEANLRPGRLNLTFRQY